MLLFNSNIVDKDVENILINWNNYILVKYSLNTVESYKRDVKNFLQFLVNYYDNKTKINIKIFSNLQINDFRAWLLCLRNKPKSSSARSRARSLSSIKNFFLYCNVNNLFVNNSLYKISTSKIEKKLPCVISEDDLNKILCFIAEKSDNYEWLRLRNVVIFLLLYGCGLRISEVLNLKMKDINDNGVSVIGKGGKQRLVPMLDIIKDKLDAYKSICPYMKNLNSLYFCSKFGKRLQRTYFANKMQQWRQVCDLEYKLTPHSLRHSCATHLVNNGINTRIVQEILGHESLSSTQIYTKVNYSYLKSSYCKAHLRK